MASSDDEGETLPDAVSDYYFCDGDDEPLSFVKLPVQWNENERSISDAQPIFLSGTADNGLQKLYKQVKAWKFDFSKDNPEISVCYKDSHWFKLQKPRKSYEKEIRTILITVQCLYFFKSEPEASGKALWDHLSKVFRLYDVRPSENDLVDHMNFIKEVVKRDEMLARSKFLAAFLENPRKRKDPDENAEIATKPSFIVDDMNDDEPQDDDFIAKQTEDSESDEEDDHFDSVCAICDNGGQLTCCEGKCFRSFHATKDIEEAEESNCQSLNIPPEFVKGSQPFRCENCLYSLHQCFVCGELGSATCGHFYHPRCVAKLLQQDDEAEPQDLEKKIAVGEPFICPSHRCVVCKQTENEKAMSNIIPQEIQHEIDGEIGTPARNLKFQDILKNKTDQRSKKKKVAVTEAGTDSEITFKKTSIQKSKKGIMKSSAVKPENSSKKRANVSSGPESLKKKKIVDTNRSSLRRTSSTKVKTPSSNDNQPSLGSRLYEYMQKGTESNELEKDDPSVVDDKHTMAAKALQKEILPPLDADSRLRILALMKDAASSITLDEVKKYHKGKALHVALQKIEKGCSIEDAMAVCEPGVLGQISRWKEKLKVYLAPFLHGMRYTSFGRHFTKVEKLEKIIDKLQWYVEDGDTVVDFCCGANDFSCLIKKRLDEMGKRRCSYKNYDITRPKNDFNFEKRDWMTVAPKELPRGSRLIMGINPPLDSEQQKIPYDLIWEDVKLLAGKSFYLPGSVDTNDKQMDQWNNTPPPLYLWSRADWTSKHLAIAHQHGHISGVQDDDNLGLSNENKGIGVGLPVPLDDLPVTNKVSEQTTDKPKTDMKKGKKESPSHYDDGTETKRKQIVKEKTNQNSSKRNDHNQEFKRAKHDDKRSPDLSRQDHAPKHEDRCSPAPPSLDQAQKHDDKLSLAPPHQDEGQKHDKKRYRDPSYQDEAQKHEDKHSPASSCQDHARKLDDNRSLVSSRQDHARKHDDNRSLVPSHQDHPRKHDDNRSPVPSHEDHAWKHDDKRFPAPSRRDHGLKHDGSHSPASSRQDHGPKHDDNRSPAPGRQDQARKHDDKCSPAHETMHLEVFDQHLERRYNSPTAELGNSFQNDAGPSFDHRLERRYNSITDESTFSFQNDLDQHLERRYGSTAEEPFLGTTYRRLDGANLATPGYSTRLDHSPYPAYDRFARGSYLEEINTRGGGGYMMSHHEKGLTRYGPAETAPYNRTSTSTTQRYAPRLDELNHTQIGRPELDELNHPRMGMGWQGLDELNHPRMGIGRPELNELNHPRMGRPELNELNHPRMSMGRGAEPSITNQRLMSYGPALHGPGFHTDSTGFASGPYHRYSQPDSSSGGWLNE
ncbi:DNA (cytosine-5)-methyltransferase 1, replication foci domain-containing protein [Cynara cardunculus var. scolymus]|uniref:DNA (Cytosine-5)-methyltransferase 1, replication foci domain-containing protein n=1 Tax=Cynara cardunculus var. scolymus TaxID=59895 RepID=A0A124SE69_CYNCS|nr:DNA (cytosine-5)-methyltransferase 1, replication foci domain-containing protein [Cynara cardunculus var. scolymus]